MTNIDAPPSDVAKWLQVAVDQRKRNVDRLKTMWGPGSAAVAQAEHEIETIKSAVTSAIKQAINQPLAPPATLSLPFDTNK